MMAEVSARVPGVLTQQLSDDATDRVGPCALLQSEDKEETVDPAKPQSCIELTKEQVCRE